MASKIRYKTIVLSDLHLGTSSSKAKEVTNFLKNNKCETLILNGEFESVCEAFYLDKPVLMVPVEGHFEQLSNGHDAQKNEVDIYELKFNIDTFLDWIPSHQSKSASFRKWEERAEALFIKNFNEVLESSTDKLILPEQLIPV